MPDFVELRRGFLREDVRAAAEDCALAGMTDQQQQIIISRLVHLMDRDNYDVITMPLDSFRGMYSDIITHH